MKKMVFLNECVDLNCHSSYELMSRSSSVMLLLERVTAITGTTAKQWLSHEATRDFSLWPKVVPCRRHFKQVFTCNFNQQIIIFLTAYSLKLKVYLLVVTAILSMIARRHSK